MPKAEKESGFYMVCRNPDEVAHSNPKSFYRSLEQAKTRAESLAKDTGHRFYILVAFSYVEPATPPLEWRHLDIADVEG